MHRPTLAVVCAIAAFGAAAAFAGPTDVRRAPSEQGRAQWGAAFRETFNESAALRDQFPTLAEADWSQPETLLRSETLIDRVEAVLPTAEAFRGLSPAEREALVKKTVDSIKDPIFSLAQTAWNPNTPNEVLLGMAFKVRWQMNREALYFTRDEINRMAGQVETARGRLSMAEAEKFDAAAKALELRSAESALPSDVPLANFFPILSPEIPFVDQRIYHPSAAARLKPSAPRTVVWDVNHTGENHVDPFLEGLELRPDYRTAKAEVKREGFSNIDWSQAEHWWLDAFFKTHPETLKTTSAVIAAENYMGMTAAEKKAHPQVAEILKTRPTGKAISFLGYRVIIDDNDAVLPTLAKSLGFAHILVPRAFSNRAAEGDILTRAAQEAVDHLRRLAAVDDDPHPHLNFWAGILLLVVAAVSALLLWYQIAHYWATIEWQIRSSIGVDIEHFFH